MNEEKTRPAVPDGSSTCIWFRYIRFSQRYLKKSIAGFGNST